MGSELRDLVQGTADAKQQLFASEDFAGEYGRAVTGRVRRRRAVSATALGGGTVVAVGALAVGASNLPSGIFAFGGPASAPGVLCTTTSAAATSPALLEEVPLSVLNVPSPSGSLIWGIALGEHDPPHIAVNVSLDLSSQEVTASISGGDPVALTPDGEGVYWVEVSDYSSVIFAIEDEELVLQYPSLEVFAEPEATVTCVTATPEPSVSGSPVSQTSTTPVPAAKPSPFQCGFTFSTAGRSNADATIGYVEWVTAEEAETTIRADYADPDSAEIQLSGEQVPITQIQLATKWTDDEVPGMLMMGDPAEVGGEVTAEQFVDNYGTYVVGVGYVLAVEGVVVATGMQDGGGQVQYMTSNPLGVALYGLDLEAGMPPCAGVDDAILADAEVVAVTGISSVVDGEIRGPFYAWNVVGGP